MNLDSLFLLPSSVEGKGSTLDVSGLIGQYAHGNEPSHLMVYLYALAGKPEKTNNLINQVMNTLNNNT
jgi:putative alpha-1,2-mannosidase